MFFLRLSFVYSFNSTASFACKWCCCCFCVFVSILFLLYSYSHDLRQRYRYIRQAASETVFEYQFQNIGHSNTLDVSILLYSTHTLSLTHRYVHSQSERFSLKSQMPALIVNLTNASYWNCSKTQQWCHAMVFFLLYSPAFYLVFFL